MLTARWEQRVVELPPFLQGMTMILLRNPRGKSGFYKETEHLWKLSLASIPRLFLSGRALFLN